MSNQPIDMHSEAKMGGKATQIATQNNYYGMSYSETRQLCVDLIHSELVQYKEEAKALAEERSRKLEETFLKKLADEKISDESVGEEFKNPDMQMAYLGAQKTYIRLGSEELEETLSSLLVDRVKERDRSLLQIALGEALTVVNQLLPEQLDILAILFLVKYTHRNGINSPESFSDYIRNSLMLHMIDKPQKISIFQHLEYTKVATTEVIAGNFGSYMNNGYTGLFMKGFTETEIEDSFKKYPSLFIRYLYNNELIQFNAMDENVLKEKLDSLDISETECNRITEMYKKNMMSEEETEKKIIDLVPESKKLIELWNNTTMAQLRLTSVGIVLGAERVKQLSGNSINMSIWI